MPSPPPPTRVSIKVEKWLTYRGQQKHWSNRYFFSGAGTLTDSEFDTLRTALLNAEKLCLSGGVAYVSAVGYNAGSEVPVHTTDISSITPAFDQSGLRESPGDAAAMIRFSTDQRTTKNHPIYLFKYMHKVYSRTTDAVDVLAPTQKTAFQTFANACIAGFSDGTTTRHICGPYGAVGLAATVDPWIRHRDFRN